MLKKICSNYIMCLCAVVYHIIINQCSVIYQLLFHCPSEAFKLCIVVKNYLPCYDVAFNKFGKQNDEDFVTTIAKRTFTGTILAITMKKL